MSGLHFSPTLLLPPFLSEWQGDIATCVAIFPIGRTTSPQWRRRLSIHVEATNRWHQQPPFTHDSATPWRGQRGGKEVGRMSRRGEGGGQGWFGCCPNNILFGIYRLTLLPLVFFILTPELTQNMINHLSICVLSLDQDCCCTIIYVNFTQFLPKTKK